MKEIELITHLPYNVIDKVGAIESNSPKKICKWSPMNNESGKLPIGTEIYYINDKTLTGIAAYVDGNYIYCCL